MTVEKMKQELCYVSLDFEAEVDTVQPSEFTLPDGTVVRVHNQAIRCPELMFKPRLVGQDRPGLHQLVLNTVNNSDSDLRLDLLKSITVSGGNTMFTNLPERLKAEVQGLLSEAEASNVGLIAPPDRDSAVWVGGSLLTSLSTFDKMWIQRQHYEEEGPRIVQLLCNL